MKPPPLKPGTKRCALYTRKSSEEGLEQDFNSLHAQREACASYVSSQKAEGWKALPAVYDDGGYSGGTIERPALRRLLDDVRSGNIDIIVVYKIDRLTRSLADFARMVELFERHQVSFVSVTQAFNTTSSMGRLTLNVLLSFAQFEREVTGERIRDKIAASKAKGMWMGGTLPLGYDLSPSGARTLVANVAEAEAVRRIFETYLKLGSVHALQRQLRLERTFSKCHTSAKGRVRGGVFFGRGALFHLLRNRLYLGEIIHRGHSHAGLHPAIIDRELFDAVQIMLDSQARRAKQNGGAKANSALAGRIFDGDGQPMCPTFAYGRGGRLYRYYVSASLQQGRSQELKGSTPRRISASTIEDYLAARLSAAPSAPIHQVLDLVLRVEIHASTVLVFMPVKLGRQIASDLRPNETIAPYPGDPDKACLTLPFRVSTRHGRTELVAGSKSGPSLNAALIQALRAAHALLDQDKFGQPTIVTAPASSHRRQLIGLAFLAPDIQEAILAGRQPSGLTLAELTNQKLPVAWADQRKAFGWPSAV